ncbi:MAG: hypothetical protein JRJ18_07195 [Deltaproteobacteria bacterium]|nr:hypothetical protein [Deltaproteobacteria bacterium]
MRQKESQEVKDIEGNGTFWNRCVQAVRQEGVPEYQQRWHVTRAREFLKAHPGTGLRMHDSRSLMSMTTLTEPVSALFAFERTGHILKS